MVAWPSAWVTMYVGMIMVRRTLQVGLAALGVAALLTLVWNVALGAGQPTVGQVIVSYSTWGRWATVATLVVYGVLIVAAPLLPGAGRSGHVILAGAAVAAVGKLLELSRGIEAADITASALPVGFTAGRLTELSALTASTFTWAGGAILLAVGLVILAIDAEDRRWRRASTALAVSLVFTALTHVNAFGLLGVHWFASWISLGLVGLWLFIALDLESTPEESPLSSNRQDGSARRSR
jgi:hypothetical protein